MTDANANAKRQRRAVLCHGIFSGMISHPSQYSRMPRFKSTKLTGERETVFAATSVVADSGGNTGGSSSVVLLVLLMLIAIV